MICLYPLLLLSDMQIRKIHISLHIEKCSEFGQKNSFKKELKFADITTIFNLFFFDILIDNNLISKLLEDNSKAFIFIHSCEEKKLKKYFFDALNIIGFLHNKKRNFLIH